MAETPTESQMVLAVRKFHMLTFGTLNAEPALASVCQNFTEAYPKADVVQFKKQLYVKYLDMLRAKGIAGVPTDWAPGDDIAMELQMLALTAFSQDIKLV